MPSEDSAPVQDQTDPSVKKADDIGAPHTYLRSRLTAPQPRPKLTVASIIYITIALVVSMLTGLVFAWWRNDWALEASGMIGDSMAPFVGMLSLGALAIALWSATLQEREIERQHRTYEEDLERERIAELKSVYAPFLTAVRSYHEAIRNYLETMMRTGFEADMLDREEWLQPVTEAHARVDDALQSIILVDEDKERGELRWHLARSIKVSSHIDTAVYQRLWMDVVMWKMHVATGRFVALRDSLLRATGRDVAERSEPANAEQLAVALKQSADKAEATIMGQVKEQLRRAHARKVAAEDAERERQRSMIEQMTGRDVVDDEV